MRHIKILAVLFAMTLLWGCDGLLDTSPQQSIKNDLALSTDENVKAALIGAYNNMGSYYTFGGQYYMLPDLMAMGQEAQWSGTYEQPGQIYRKSILVDNSFVRDVWLDSYATINTANSVISALDVVNEADRARVEAEARFIRGVTYFELVRFYGKDYSDGDPTSSPGVPIVLKPTDTISKDDEVPRNTVQQVYDQAISDLSFAKDNLPESNFRKDNEYATTYAASAFLARIYLQQGDYANARDESSRVVESGQYSLVADYADAFNKSHQNTSEDIFAMQVTSQDGVNTLNTFYASQDDGGRGDIEIQQAHLDLYEAGDARLDLFYQDGFNVRTGKWKNQYGNINVIRLAEMYLVRAESNLQEGTTVGDTPLNDINRIRERANLADASSVTIQDVWDQRHLELAFEGHFLWDLKRTQGSVGSIQWNDPSLVFPIPQREMDANPQLTQNPGYGN